MESGLKRATMKMKRSSSRVAELWATLPSHHSHSLPITTPTAPPKDHVGFPPSQSPSTAPSGLEMEEGMEKMRKWGRHSSQLFREVVSILADRSDAEAAYAKSLKKLGSRLGKLGPEWTGEVETGWSAIQAAMAGEAAVHKSLGQSLREDIVGPLKSLGESEAKTRRGVEGAVDRSLRQLADARSAQAKLKRSLHSLAREEEKLESLLEEDARRPFPVKSEKQTTKVRSRLGKVREGLESGERLYAESVVEGERVREETGRTLAAGAARLRALDAQRRATTQTTLGRLRHLFSRHSADLSRSTQSCLDKLETAMGANAAQESYSALATTLSSSPPFKIIHLADFHAEDFSVKIGAERRRAALTRELRLIQSLLEKERRSQHGLQSLSNIYETAPKFSDQESRSSVRHKLSDTCDLVEALGYEEHKLRCALAGIDSRRFPVPGPHPLSQYQERTKDKWGLWETRLRVPVREEEGLLGGEEAESGSSESEWGDAAVLREAADGQSPVHSPLETAEPIYEAVSESECVVVVKQTTQLPGSAGEDEDSSEDEEGERAGEYCVALYDFHPQRPDEVELRAGERVRILGQRSSDWWEGEAGDGGVGLFPVNYVTRASTTFPPSHAPKLG